MYGYWPNSVCSGLDCGLVWTPVLSVTHIATKVAYAAWWTITLFIVMPCWFTFFGLPYAHAENERTDFAWQRSEKWSLEELIHWPRCSKRRLLNEPGHLKEVQNMFHRPCEDNTMAHVIVDLEKLCSCCIGLADCGSSAALVSCCPWINNCLEEFFSDNAQRIFHDFWLTGKFEWISAVVKSH